MRIAIIHPEGNYNNNPNLSGIIEILAESGHLIDIYAPRLLERDQTFERPGVSVFLTDATFAPEDGFVLLPSRTDPSFLSRSPEIAELQVKPDLVIGVDRGIIEACVLATCWQIPYALISYEIYFAVEAPEHFKVPEIAACANISFAVCQDAVRTRELCRENQIDPRKVIQIPVAGRKPRPGERTTLLHDALELSPERKIALYMGELSGKWSGIDDILLGTEAWPEEWALVLHHRYGNGSATGLVEKVMSRRRRNVYFSPFPTLPFSDLGELLYSVDVGLAFYHPDPSHIGSNRNLEFIGMASGKTSTYFQHGVSVITNQIGELSDLIGQHSLGYVVSDGTQIAEALCKISAEPEILSPSRVLSFFAVSLDLDIRILPLLDALASAGKAS